MRRSAGAGIGRRTFIAEVAGIFAAPVAVEAQPGARRGCQRTERGVDMSTSLVGQNAFITGAGSGIGLACARAFARDGASVTLFGRNREKLERAAAQVRETSAVGTSVRIFPGDVGEEATVEAGVAKALEAGPLTIAVANAGIGASRRSSQCRSISVARFCARTCSAQCIHSSMLRGRSRRPVVARCAPSRRLRAPARIVSCRPIARARPRSTNSSRTRPMSSVSPVSA